MKYTKGTFNTIPNKNYLRGKHSAMQSIYFWVVDHANESGVCFPKRATLASEAGCDIKTVDKYIKVLVEEGFMEKTTRRGGDTIENKSNLYQILIKQSTENGIDREVQTSENGSLQYPENGAVTKPSLTKPNNTTEVPNGTGSTLKPKEEKVPYSFKEELEKLGNSTWKPNKIIYNYWKVKGFEFENKKQFDSAVKREIRPAKLLEGYSAIQINKTMDYCLENYKTIPWTLETVVKRISDVVNKKL